MLTDTELIAIHHKATDDAMHAANERDGFGSNMSRESIVAGLRAVEAAVRADQIEKDHDKAGEVARLHYGKPSWDVANEVASDIAAAIRAQLEGTTDE